ncbi:alpha/beta fold hydrolase [Micromonospora sp. NPDC049679]|uniref:alpha/beta hydrolase family protein n=1 Tax=Micromonospora sp. NPDC049679 TaxID=3155920 RepID=UPI0033EA4346
MAADPRAVLTRPAPAPDATVRYGEHPDQVADVRLPAGDHDAPPRPLVVVIHGGFWRAEYDRTHTGPLAADLAARGYPVAQLEYRRTGQPGGGWPGTFEDVANGIAALPRLVSTVVAGPPILLGHSAGGHLAIWYATTGAAVRGVVALAPVADLAEGYELDLDGGAVAALLGGGPEEVPERYVAADPTLRVPPQSPTVVIHGELDRQVPAEMSRRYAARARADGGDVTLIALPESEHFGLIDPLSSAWPRVTEALHSLH